MSIAERIGQVREERRQRRGQKELSHHPELQGREHLLSQRSDEVVPEIDGYAGYATVYQSYVWVRKAIGKISDAIVSLPVRVVDADGKAVAGHPVSKLLAAVNDQMNPADLWQRWVIHMMLAGEAFLELVPDGRGRPAELWPRRPDEVGVRPDVSRPDYPAAGGYTWREHEIDPEWMVHDRFYNPLNPWRGLAPIAAVRAGVVIDMFAQAWSRLFLQRGARPDYGVIAPAGLTVSEREEIETTLAAKFGGSEGWHKPIVLEQGVTDIKVFSWAPKDIEWLEQRRNSREEVGGLFGVPDEIMGWGRDTYENFGTAHRVFWQLTLVPLTQHRDTSLTHFFGKVRGELRPGESLRTDLSEVRVLQEDIGPKLEAAKSLWEMAVPFNRIDEVLGLGVGPVPGGEVGYLPFSVMPVAPAKAATRAPAAKAPRRGVPEYGSPAHIAMWKAYDARLRPFERRMQAHVRRELEAQEERAQAGLDAQLGKAPAEWEEKAPAVVIDAGTLLDWTAEEDAWAEEFEADFAEAVQAFGDAQLGTLGLGVAFDVQNPLVLDVIRALRVQFAADINQTTQRQLAETVREILLEAETEGWSIVQIQRAVRERISEVYRIREQDYETERIARTEMLKASNAGNLEAMRQSGVVERKAWLAALDDRTRETHIKAHEQYSSEGIGLNEDFEVGSDRMPAPGQGSVPEENINCRCTCVAVI